MSDVMLSVEQMGLTGGEYVLDLGCGNVNQMFKVSGLNITYADKVVPTNLGKEIFFKIDLDQDPLAFADKQFEFVIASHVLEHLEDPVGVCKQISRIGQRGVVSAPSVFTEIFWNWGSHRWFIIDGGSTLYFIRKEPKLVTDFHGFLHKVCAGNPEFNKDFVREENRQIMYIRHLWTHELNVEYVDTPNSIQDLLMFGAEKLKEITQVA